MISDARQFVWDLPIRLFHWLLVALLGFSWWSAETYHMDWHRWSGQAVLFLVVFRLIWGFVGSGSARFAYLLKGPRAIRAYLAGGVAPVGHNPLGGWSVIAMLLLLMVQLGTGLFAVDIDGIESGPLSHLVDFDQGRLAAAIHATSFTILQILIGLHVAAVLFYLLARRRNLIGAMLTGRTAVASEAVVPVRRARAVTFLIAVTLSGVIAWWVFADPML
ncbi:cytochrome b/b6 domain-containing protein [Sphingobium sp. BYY-5]|uniref:cytochrome b/b6 domain-containing protein n=1 Tax=Sphingobium sp. BYY-5 TaxID=2926400 RepID=UPI001FA7E10A|nr:cytochrome b/b6 domain-containing protein [Sphingobium sp. BYY-5]MCI4592679.1 cytochrome b/b6 domain-containing protein [Sphingobium sp. BYY-5]